MNEHLLSLSTCSNLIAGARVCSVDVAQSRRGRRGTQQPFHLADFQREPTKYRAPVTDEFGGQQPTPQHDLTRTRRKEPNPPPRQSFALHIPHRIKRITGPAIPKADSPFQTTKPYDASVTEPDRGCHCPGRLIIDLLDRDPRLSGYDVSTGPHEFSNPPSRDRHAEESHEVSDGYNGVVQQVR